MTWRRLPWFSSRLFFRTMMFHPLAKAPSMKAWGRASVSRNSIRCGSTTTISPTVAKSGVRRRRVHPVAEGAAALDRGIGLDFLGPGAASPEGGDQSEAGTSDPGGAEKDAPADRVDAVGGGNVIGHGVNLPWLPP